MKNLILNPLFVLLTLCLGLSFEAQAQGVVRQRAGEAGKNGFSITWLAQNVRQPSTTDTVWRTFLSPVLSADGSIFSAGNDTAHVVLLFVKLAGDTAQWSLQLVPVLQDGTTDATFPQVNLVTSLVSGVIGAASGRSYEVTLPRRVQYFQIRFMYRKPVARTDFNNFSYSLGLYRF